MRGKEEMTQEAIVEKIINMGQVVAILHVVSFFLFFFDCLGASHLVMLTNPSYALTYFSSRCSL